MATLSTGYGTEGARFWRGGSSTRACVFVRSSSTQFAGVGGTGPNAVTPLGGGRLVGGDSMGSDAPPKSLLVL